MLITLYSTATADFIAVCCIHLPVFSEKRIPCDSSLAKTKSEVAVCAPLSIYMYSQRCIGHGDSYIVYTTGQVHCDMVSKPTVVQREYHCNEFRYSAGI